MSKNEQSSETFFLFNVAAKSNYEISHYAIKSFDMFHSEFDDFNYSFSLQFS